MPQTLDRFIAMVESNAHAEAIEARQPATEIRRLQPDKQTVHDLRTGCKAELDEERGLALDPLVDAYLRWRVFSADADEEDDR